jgi:UDP-glucose 4-epimerase
VFLVTGGAGFTGSHLVERLVRDGERVRMLDVFSSGKQEHPALCVKTSRWSTGILLTPRRLPTQWRASRSSSTKQPLSPCHAPLRNHRRLSLRILPGCSMCYWPRDAGCRRVVFASLAIYDDTNRVPPIEDLLTHPHPPYAISKLTEEQLCRAFTHV